jgi:hypothetical protein
MVFSLPSDSITMACFLSVAAYLVSPLASLAQGELWAHLYSEEVLLSSLSCHLHGDLYKRGGVIPRH